MKLGLISGICWIGLGIVLLPVPVAAIPVLSVGCFLIMAGD